jgi:hypothetical protein
MTGRAANTRATSLVPTSYSLVIHPRARPMPEQSGREFRISDWGLGHSIRRNPESEIGL